MTKTSILEQLVEEDFGITGNPQSRWAKAGEHDSLVVDRDRDIFFWNSREIYGNVVDYLVKVRGMSLEYAKRYSKNFEQGKSAFTTRFDSNSNGKVQTSPALARLFWESGKENRGYWYNRTLKDKTIDRFLLGNYNGWFTLPIFDGAELINIQLRRDEPEKKIRAWYKHRPATILNKALIKHNSTIYFTEGTVDAILLCQYGLPAITKSFGGHVWKDEWLPLFMHVKEIFYIADNDKPGIEIAKKIAKKLGELKVKIYVFSDKEEKFDSVDFFREGGCVEEFLERVHNESKYSFEL